MNLLLAVVVTAFQLVLCSVLPTHVHETDVIMTNSSVKVTTTTQKVPRVPGWSTNICVDLCPKWCQKPAFNRTMYTDCHFICGNICTQQTRDTNPFLGNQEYEVVPISFLFSDYDINKDKLLSIEEIARTEKVPTDDALRLFEFADFNNDGFIGTEEFQGGPFVFTVQMAAEMTAVSRIPAVKQQ